MRQCKRCTIEYEKSGRLWLWRFSNIKLQLRHHLYSVWCLVAETSSWRCFFLFFAPKTDVARHHFGACIPIPNIPLHTSAWSLRIFPFGNGNAFAQFWEMNRKRKLSEIRTCETANNTYISYMYMKECMWQRNAQTNTSPWKTSK